MSRSGPSAVFTMNEEWIAKFPHRLTQLQRTLTMDRYLQQETSRTILTKTGRKKNYTLKAV